MPIRRAADHASTATPSAGKPRPGSIERHPDFRAARLLMNMMFSRHLTALYKSFDGDLVEAVVLGEVAHHNLAQLFNVSRTPQQLSGALQDLDVDRHQALLPTNAFSIAQATGIPRETVRRKLASLLRRGWLVRDTNGNLFVAANASVAFTTFNAERLRDLLDTMRAIGSLLTDRPRRDTEQGGAPDRQPRPRRPPA